MVKNLLIKGNSKMGPSVYLFNLPARKTCTPTDWCLQGMNGKPSCYALRNNFLLPSVIKAANERFEASQQEDFVERMIGEISKKNPHYFRFHASGDFYSEEYVEKVIEISRNSPDTLFRTTTRRRDLVKIIRKLNELPNFIVRESLDSERTSPEMGLPFAALSSLRETLGEESYQCLNDCPQCGYHCWESSCDMYFDEH